MNNSFYQNHIDAIRNCAASSLQEDIGSGDLTGISCLDRHQLQSVICLIKSPGILAGIEMAELICQMYSSKLKLTPYFQDGNWVESDDIIFTLEGPQMDILTVERVLLNFMQRMSGIATLTQKMVRQIEHTDCKILDTRKTTPNFRIAEKWAVNIGGGVNHRMGLYDAIMIKDNHIDFCGGIGQAIEKSIGYLKTHQLNFPIIVETRTLSEVKSALEYAGIKRILLDNMTVEIIKQAVDLVDHQVPLEASGNINSDNIRAFAETGVDFISMGYITYGATIIDMSFRMKKP